MADHPTTSPIPKASRLTGSLDGVSSLRIDTERTCLEGKKVSYEISSDGPATITFSDGRKLSLPGGGVAQGTLAR